MTTLREAAQMSDIEKIIYDILCSNEQPPEGQHWEGLVASKIAAALEQAKPATYTSYGLMGGDKFVIKDSIDRNIV